MESVNTKTKSIITILGTMFANKFNLLFPTLILLIILMFVDYISGMLASKKEALEHPNNKIYGWNSRKSIIGIYKKIGYILTILAAISTDFLIFHFSKEIGVSFDSNTLFGLLVTIWFILNELLSILENAGRMGAKLPTFFQKVLSDLQKNVDNTNNSK